MKQPTEADIEAAKAYLRQRLECEHAMTTLLENAMKEAAEKIVDICYSAGVNPRSFRYSDLPVRVQFDIDEVIQRLQEAIDDYFLTLAIADHEENRDRILPFILGENHGMTFAERLENYCGKYRDELMVLVGAGLFLGIAKSALVKSIGENLKHPYANQLIAEGIGNGISYGRGRTNSMFTALSGLTKYGIESAWMQHWELKTEADGAIGWIVQRGSSYPCPQCDDNCGFHSIDEGTQLPQHLSCCCFAVPIYIK
mgnify:CR=1 FL=1